MKRILVVGIDTDVGKTVVSTILTSILDGDYWKPVQCGNSEEGDPVRVRRLLDTTKSHVFPPAYSFQAPLSPLQAAAREVITIDLAMFRTPLTKRPLIIEAVGGVLVPLTASSLTVDLFMKWQYPCVIVSRHYLGSINHTLLTVEALKARNIPILGIIFNGNPDSEVEQAILTLSGLPMLARLLPENEINTNTIQRYSALWRPLFLHYQH